MRNAQSMAELNEHIDYPALRENFKKQVRAKLNTKALAMTPPKEAEDLLEQLVDHILTPEVMVELMAYGKRLKGESAPSNAAEQFDFSVAYDSWNRVRVEVVSPQTNQPVEVFFERTGLFSWKLVDMALPAMPR